MFKSWRVLWLLSSALSSVWSVEGLYSSNWQKSVQVYEVCWATQHCVSTAEVALSKALISQLLWGCCSPDPSRVLSDRRVMTLCCLTTALDTSPKTLNSSLIACKQLTASARSRMANYHSTWLDWTMLSCHAMGIYQTHTHKSTLLKNLSCLNSM